MSFVTIHEHVFTDQHVPDGFLPLGLVKALRVKPIGHFVNWLLRHVGWRGDMLDRVRRVLLHIEAKSQQENFERLVDLHWPCSVEYREDGSAQPIPKPTICVLGMDFTYAGLGHVPVSVEEQIAEACALEYRGVRPKVFLPIDPRRNRMIGYSSVWGGPLPISMSLTAWTETMLSHYPQIAGLKLYCPLGYRANDPRLDPVWELAQERNLPVISHMGGTSVRGKGVSKQQALDLMNVADVRDVLTRFPKLRWDLAHCGGAPTWTAPITSSGFARQLDIIRALSDFPDQLFVDCSYAAFADATRGPITDWLSMTDRTSQILFGTDWPLVDIERGDLRAEIDVLRDRIGEARWSAITADNPRRFLEAV